ncbi:uncharacterized protein A4U43_C08F8410, partial [Asparagus officinalis]
LFSPILIKVVEVHEEQHHQKEILEFDSLMLVNGAIVGRIHVHTTYSLTTPATQCFLKKEEHVTTIAGGWMRKHINSMFSFFVIIRGHEELIENACNFTIIVSLLTHSNSGLVLSAMPPAAKKSHPTHLEMVGEAIGSLKERTGSSPHAIAKFIEGKHKTKLPSNFKSFFSSS